MKLAFHKLTHWEYWPFELLYFPVFFLWAYYALRARSLFFFNAVNPSMKNGGFFMVSKAEIYQLIPPQYYPKTNLVSPNMSVAEVLDLVQKQAYTFPIIAKPDMGLRGSAVQIIADEAALQHYHNKAQFDYLLQALIPYANEVGIFYVRYPHESQGRITGIVAKEFLQITGDGTSTREQLLQKDPRAAMQLPALRKEQGNNLQTVLPLGEVEKVVPYGNHIRGTKFIDASQLITPELTAVIENLCSKIDGFYYGRLDVMYHSIEDLAQGKNFSVVELNGAMSEPTHMYDPSHSIWFAWRELFRHITYLFKISQANHALGHPYLPHKVGMQQYRLHQKHNQKILDF
jgi:hypothetical protein